MPKRRDTDDQPSKDYVVQMLDEARMVMPGIQTLFGFQLNRRVEYRLRAVSMTQRMSHF